MSSIPVIGRFKRIFPAIILLLIFRTGMPQGISIKAELDTNRALIGDQLKLFLGVETPAHVRIDFPGLKDTIGQNIEIISDTFTDTAALSSGSIAYGRNLLITVFDTGYFVIPALDFVAHADHDSDTITTPPLPFMISAVPLDSALHDIKANLKAPVNLAEIIYYVRNYYPFGLLALGAGLLAWFLVRYLRRKLGRRKDLHEEIPVELPEVTALRELERLREEQPWLHNRVKQYYIRLSEVLREYIERRFHVMALEQTTDEILDALKTNHCTTADINSLAGMLRLADWVKFAKVIPDARESAQQVDLAAEFVRNTSVHDGTLTPEDGNTANQVQTKISADV